ncbi:MAG: ferrous iron transport protein B [Anaerolineaceae bacterium]|nr:ferrous iron transport protein B [Anaerolineaceae bacterium]
MKFLLLGQPNCGKSTLFNQVCGYKAETGNFTGTTVTYTESSVRLKGQVVGLVDMPGTYSLAGSNPAEQVVLEYLLNHQDYDCIINVADASHLGLNLTLTLELLELARPMILVLNMIDEADHLGIHVNLKSLSEKLGIPVVPMIASKGRGIREVFTTAHAAAMAKAPVRRQPYHALIEESISLLRNHIGTEALPLKPEAIAIKLIEKDPLVLSALSKEAPDLLAKAEFVSKKLTQNLHKSSGDFISIERSRLSGAIADSVTVHSVRKLTLRDKLDNYLLHPFWGYVFLILFLYVFFQAVFRIGGLIEAPLLNLVSSLEVKAIALLHPSKLLGNVLVGLIQGISGGLAIVLPYLVPFLIGLGIMEDSGYLPRVAFLMDALMHRIGLHGAAIVPFILGFGCNVPSIMATRTLDNKKEQFIAAALATLVPCSARLAVVFGLVAFYLGPLVALIIYLLIFFVIALTGKLLSKFLPKDTPGLILEIPPYRQPSLKSIFSKAWFRIKEFLIEAWPVLIFGSIILSLLNSYDLTKYINVLTKPFTWALGLPQKSGVPLIFGVLRKELSLIMLGQAMGDMDFKNVLTPVQMVTFTVFVIFYMPCLATLVTLHKELGRKSMWNIMGITLIIATATALIARGVASIFY